MREGLVVPRCPQKMCNIGVTEPTQQGEGEQLLHPQNSPRREGKGGMGPLPRQAEPPSASSEGGGAEGRLLGRAGSIPTPPSQAPSPGSAADSRLHTGTAAGTAAREATKMI